MKTLFKTLLGDAATIAWVAGSVLFANRVIASEAHLYAGVLIPLALLVGVGLLARR
ncbi:hypothetical protein [Acidiphilium sp.]|uniref:hypothetical protein n=1 Tax=Acidiphilium sp. TaxID=527 RepID=UPI003CFC1FFD